MDDWLAALERYVTPEKALTALRAALLVAAGLLVARIVSRGLARLLEGRLDVQQLKLLRRFSFYGVFLLFAVAALHQMGFQVGVLLGAAGVFSVALGFASQTSASNFISGLFLVVERPFTAGDVIQVGGTTGEVLSVDLLALKLRTFDNLFVRIPNETLLKSEVRTLTRFPIRRFDLQVGVAYREDLRRVHAVLVEAADREPLCLAEPKPLFQILAFGDSSINLQFSVWARRECFLDLKYRIQLAVKEAFDREGIEIPFPQRVISADGRSGALPVRLEGTRADGGETPGGA